MSSVVKCVKDFYSFDKMATPCIIKIVFWVLVVMSVVCGVGTIIHSFGTDINVWQGYYHVGGSVWLFVYGVVQIIVGIIISKVFCELIIVLYLYS